MNPFSLPSNDPEVYIERERQRSVERSLVSEQRLLPLHMRKTKRQLELLSELRKKSGSTEPSFNRHNRSYSHKSENLQDLILRKREILLTKKKIEHKLQSISLIDSTLKSNEEKHKIAVKSLEENLMRVEKYEDNLKSEAKRKADMAERKIQERIVKTMELNGLSLEIERLYADIERRSEELRHLSVHRDFVLEVSSSSEVDNTFVTTEFDMDYNNDKLIKGIDSMEEASMFMIKQLQEAELGLESFKTRATSEYKDLYALNESLENNIKSLEKHKDSLISRGVSLRDEHFEKPLVSPETMKAIHLALVEMYGIVKGETNNAITDFEILEYLEIAIRSEINKSKLLGEEELRQKEKDIDRARRFKNVEAMKIKEIEAAREVAEKMERRKKKVVKNYGRGTMERSRIPEKKIMKKRVNTPQEILDRREFLEEFIPFP